MRVSRTLTLRLALAFTLSTAAVTAVCIVALVTLVNISERTRAVVLREVELLRDAAAFDALIYQKGFVADYILTRDSQWLHKLEDARAQFARWAARPKPWLDHEERKLLDELMRENDAYDQLRRTAIERFDAGRVEEAVALIPNYHVHIDRLVELAQQFSAAARRETERSLVSTERTIRRLAWLLVATSLIGALASVTVGFLWARRIARPMYQLQLQVESAAQRTKVHVSDATEDKNALADRIVALVQKAEEADVALGEQRRRLIQSEKLSAIGELAAKLGHEILNPLAGMKAAVQLMSLQAEARELTFETLAPTVEALEREVTRIEQLIRRLIGYARPLAPEIQLCSVRNLLEAAEQAALQQLRGARWQFAIEAADDVPPIEVDPLLMTQVFVNLYRNAAEAMPKGGAIVTRVSQREVRGRREVQLEIEDEGHGLAPELVHGLFTPFRSTKATGHGLGLATSRNIVVEHGGTLEARNRSDRSGASFRVSLPAVR